MQLDVSKPMRFRRKKDICCAGECGISGFFCTAEIVDYRVTGFNHIQIKLRKGYQSNQDIDYQLRSTFYLSSGGCSADVYMDSVLENFDDPQIIYDTRETKRLGLRLQYK